MGRIRVFWHPEALGDLQEIAQYIARDNPGAARGVVARVEELVEILEQYPRAGRIGRAEGTRELVVPGTPYIVAYTVDGDAVDIVAVFHGARRWPEKF